MLAIKNWKPWEVLVLKACLVLVAFPVMTFLWSLLTSFLSSMMMDEFGYRPSRLLLGILIYGSAALLAVFTCQRLWPRAVSESV